jgi:hypothetical protein
MTAFHPIHRTVVGRARERWQSKCSDVAQSFHRRTFTRLATVDVSRHDARVFDDLRAQLRVVDDRIDEVAMDLHDAIERERERFIPPNALRVDLAKFGDPLVDAARNTWTFARSVGMPVAGFVNGHWMVSFPGEEDPKATFERWVERHAAHLQTAAEKRNNTLAYVKHTVFELEDLLDDVDVMHKPPLGGDVFAKIHGLAGEMSPMTAAVRDVRTVNDAIAFVDHDSHTWKTYEELLFNVDRYASPTRADMWNLVVAHARRETAISRDEMIEAPCA